MERRQRLLAEIQKFGLDGALISSPENIFYATGLSPHQLTVSRRPGFASALFRADDAAGMLCTMDYEAPALASRAQGVEIVPYATWVGVKSEREWRDKRDAPGDAPGDALPGADETLKGMFENLKLASGRVGAELQFLPAAPFVAPDQEGEVRPGMVLAIEVPFYIHGYNGFNIEDMVLVGESSAEVLTYRTPHYLDSERR